MFGWLSISFFKRLPMLRTMSFSRVPFRPIAPGSSPPWPGSSAMRIGRPLPRGSGAEATGGGAGGLAGERGGDLGRVWPGIEGTGAGEFMARFSKTSAKGSGCSGVSILSTAISGSCAIFG